MCALWRKSGLVVLRGKWTAMCKGSVCPKMIILTTWIVLRGACGGCLGEGAASVHCPHAIPASPFTHQDC